MLTRRAQGHDEAVGAGRGSRRVGVSPEWLAEDDAAARARWRGIDFALQCTRASKLGVRRRSVTRGSKPSKLGRHGLTGERGIGEGTRRQLRTPAKQCGGLAAYCDGGAEGKWRGGNGLYSHAGAGSRRAVMREKSTGLPRGNLGKNS